MFYDVYPKEEKAKNPTAFKVICQGKNEEIVGLHILGKGCDEMMQVCHPSEKFQRITANMHTGVRCRGTHGWYQERPRQLCWYVPFSKF